jgi:hypothetical protein
MRGRIALPTPKAFARPHFVQNYDNHASIFAPAFGVHRRPRVAGYVRPREEVIVVRSAWNLH